MTIPFRTKDLNEASFIWCQPGTLLTEIEPVTSDRASKPSERPETFFFKFSLEMKDSDLKTLMFGYANETTQVEPQMYVRKQNNLRDRLYAVKKRFPRGARR
jgi:hypothetical protein